MDNDYAIVCVNDVIYTSTLLCHLHTSSDLKTNVTMDTISYLRQTV